jgi:hypothetical protein
VQSTPAHQNKLVARKSTRRIEPAPTLDRDVPGRARRREPLRPEDIRGHVADQ